MADQFDRASDLEEAFRQAAIDAHRADIAPGVPGECCECLHWSPRLINDTCATCRDLLGLD